MRIEVIEGGHPNGMDLVVRTSAEEIRALTVEGVRARVAKVKESAEAGDDEMAHAKQDELYLDVLFAVSMHVPESADLAAAALACSRMKFERWCA